MKAERSTSDSAVLKVLEVDSGLSNGYEVLTMNGQNPAMEAVFNRSKHLLLDLWKETGPRTREERATAKRHSDHFSRNFFFPMSQQNFDAMSEEISRLLSVVPPPYSVDDSPVPV